jgi:hypothetical protein
MQFVFSKTSRTWIDTTEPLANYTAEKCWRSAVEAYAIGKQ